MQQITLIGIDLAKSIFQVCGVNQAVKPQFNRQVKRKQVLAFLRQFPDATIAMEACSGSNYWGRTLQQLGFIVKLIPPQHVKPFVKGNKNDRNDAFAICEAAMRPNIHTVTPRTVEQTDIMGLHKISDRQTQARTAVINQIRGLMGEYGIVAAQGKEKLQKALAGILDDAENALTPSARRQIQLLWQEWKQLDEWILRIERELKNLSKDAKPVQQLQAVRGIGLKISTAAVAYVGNGTAYKNGRHLSANLGLVPNEHSSGGKHRLGAISKRGNKYLRTLLIQGAWSIIRHVDTSTDPLSVWAKKLIARRGKHKTAVALANKLARIIWSMLYHQTPFNPKLVHCA